MSMRSAFIFILLMNICMLSNARNSDDSLVSAAKNWWKASTFGDSNFVKERSTEGLRVTYNNGRSFTRNEFMKELARYSSSSQISSEWSDVEVQWLSPQSACVTARVLEVAGRTPNNYRFLTVLVRTNSKWKVAAAQSTRELDLSPRVPIAESGKPSSYPGSYRTPGGTVLNVQLRDSSLALIEPSGTETMLVPIGPDLFEIPAILTAGNVRFSFGRDGNGKITSMTRIAAKLITMPRVN